MLARLTTLAAAGIGFLALAGYTALSRYLSDFGLDGRIPELGHYGYVHYGMYVLSYASFRSLAIGLLIGGLLAIGYWRYSNRVTEEPYHTIRVPSGPLSFGEYFSSMLADEHGRRTRSFLSDILLAAVVISLFVTAALVGEQYGGIMADRTIAGYAAVGNPGVRVRQSVQLHFLPGTYVNSAIASANRTGRLNLAWEDSNSVTVVVSGSWNPKARVASTATFYNDRLAGVGLTRKYVVDSQTGSHTPATSSTTWPALEIVFGIAMLLLVLVFAIGEYLSVRDLSIPVASITDEDIAKLNLPQPYAQRAQCALALGKDLRILRRSGGAFEVLVIRNSAFAHGSRLTWIPGYETPMQALSAFFKSLIKRINRRTDP